MPDFSDLEREAKSHSKEVDQAVDKVDQEADKEAGGRDHGLIDKGAKAAEGALGGQPDGGQQPGPQ